MDAGNHRLLVWQTLQHSRLFHIWPSKQVFYQFSPKVRCYLFITSSNPRASPSSEVLASPRPCVPTSPRLHVPAFPRPRVPASPRSRVPAFPRPRVPRPHVPASHVPRPRPTFSDSQKMIPFFRFSLKLRLFLSLFFFRFLIIIVGFLIKKKRFSKTFSYKKLRKNDS